MPKVRLRAARNVMSADGH